MNDQLRKAFADYHHTLVQALPEESLLAEVQISQKTEARLERHFKKSQKVWYPLFNTAGKRVVCILALLLLATSLITVSADPIGELLENFTLNGDRIYFDGELDWGLEETTVEPILPKYLPEGYRLLREKQRERSYRCFFEGPEAEYFVFTQSGEYGGASFYVNSAYRVIPLTKDQSAYFFENPYSNALLFNDGKYLYEINGTLSKKEMVRIAKSLLNQEVAE